MVMAVSNCTKMAVPNCTTLPSLLINFLQSTIYYSLFTLYEFIALSLKRLYIAILVVFAFYYLQYTIYYLQFIIYIVEVFKGMELKPSFHLQNQPWIC